jgi:DNA-binding XRE family transcriptional regulator
MLDKPVATMQDSKTMTLDDWLQTAIVRDKVTGKDRHITQAELADKIGVSEGTISRIRRGINTPGLDIAIKIQDITNNQVGLADLIKRGRGVAASG